MVSTNIVEETALRLCEMEECKSERLLELELEKERLRLEDRKLQSRERERKVKEKEMEFQRDILHKKGSLGYIDDNIKLAEVMKLIPVFVGNYPEEFFIHFE